MTVSIPQKINLIKQQIPSSIRLIAVTKKVSVDTMIDAYHAGIRDFGENRLQEALAKQQQLQDFSDICWHFIGHIQKNKARKILENFTWIHSVDSLSLAQRLNKLAQELEIKPKICLQVKVLPDPNKYGWQITQLQQDLLELDRLNSLDIRGLMTILPLELSSEETLNAFEKTKNLAEAIAAQNWSNLKMQELSMGMSADYLLAIQAGATMIRLGRIIFGERPQQ